MGAGGELILPLDGTWNCADDLVGGKARGLGRLIAAGYRVPPGFCISAEAYGRFLKARGLGDTIRMEIGRKPFADMRWEEIWDAALRIRGAFLSAPLPPELADPILDAYRKLASGPVAVRSSAPGEDGTTGSFAGLHESVTDVTDAQGLLDAVRIVWGSLEPHCDHLRRWHEPGPAGPPGPAHRREGRRSPASTPAKTLNE
jgi:phosphoenolpyruvate synthase/pyruvate phosphate dikinase